jgi:2-polyprenyl-6-methoxyphenol hydroxylase-like FAD-dependent oxidoreductase
LGEIGQGATLFPYLFVLGQDDNERILGKRLGEMGLSVRWNTELIGLQQNIGDVTATLKLPDGMTAQTTARWVAGCDGARSAVRERSGIAFPGAPYEHVFFVADMDARGDMVPDELNVFLWQERFHLLFPMRGQDHWRLVGILPRHLRGRSDLAFDDVIPELRAELGAAMSFGACRWFSIYRIHHRSAQRFRDRRCFLLGDAAHIHSPVGAQGMNTGLQDAYNLGWKLGLVTSGRTGDALLSSYEQERVPVAARLLNTTDRAFLLVVSEHWLAGLLRTKVAARLAGFAMGHASVPSGRSHPSQVVIAQSSGVIRRCQAA